MSRKNNPLCLLVFACLLLGALFALGPISDFDQHEALDSLLTEEFLLLPGLLSLAGYAFLIWLFATVLVPPRLCFSPLIPPPISRA
jgi:hypothetical protein